MQKLFIENSNIYIGESYLNLDTYLPQSQVIIVTDKQVYSHYKSFISNYENIVIPMGESAKTWATVEFIINELLDKNADRNTFLVGMGGGLVTDITGFVASIFMRGIRFGFVASSLLAQVDASLGGKTGINFHNYKNMVGIFNSPDFVICDANLLKTLPKREIRSGFGEVIKHALIKDVRLFTYLEENATKLLTLDAKALEEIIGRAIKIKAEVVKKDWKEKGERKQLNFGHTLGHAIENNSQLAHGEAVAVGMYWAAEWSVEKGFLEEKELSRIKRLIEKFELPTTHGVSAGVCRKFMQKDKKKQGSTIDFVFLEQIGKAKVLSVAMEELLGALKA